MEYQQPVYSMTFDDPSGTMVKGTDAAANDLTKKALHTLNHAPVIESMPDTYVWLPAGLVLDDTIIQEAEVRELTGEHEELLAKAKTTSNPAKYLQTLLQCGVVSVGNTPCTTSILDSLIQGDLDTLMLGIRKATFGNTFEVFNVKCDTCGEFNDLEMDLKDIPMKELADPEVRVFSVPLRKGRSAKVKFPTGAVQNEIFKKPVSLPEMNSITLSQCVISFTEANGSETLCNGFADVRKMSISDRETVCDYIYKNQPGPRYDEVIANCHSCEGEVPVPLNVGILFRGL